MLTQIEKYLFYIFLFSIPFQTRKILYFSGWRFNEWQSISLYGTDILILILFTFWGIYCAQNHKIRNPIRQPADEIRNKFKLLKSKFSNPNTYLILFIFISAISIKNSDNFLISWYQWIKLIEFSVFYCYLSRYAFNKFGLFNPFVAIFLSGVFQAIIAIAQFVKQSSIGLKYLGESVLNNDFSGVASFYISKSEKIIRSYGTTPHPNVLAVFLLLSLFAFYFIYLYSRLEHKGEARPERTAKLHSEHSPLADRWDRWFLIFSGVVLFAFFTTFSRTVIFVWFVTFCIRGIAIVSRKHYRIIFGTREGRDRVRAILLVSLATIILFGSLYFHESISRLTISGSDQAVELRSFYVKEAFKTNINLFGIGYGNFMSWLIKENPFLSAYAYQPVHNVFLLIYSETGILGITSFILFLFFLVKDFVLKNRLIKSYHLSFMVLFLAVVFVGMFDHMFWTLQQGRLIFWLSLSLLTL